MKWFVVITRQPGENFPVDVSILQAAQTFLTEKIAAGIILLSVSCPAKKEDWAIVEANSEADLRTLISQYPLFRCLNFEATQNIPRDVNDWPKRPDLMSSLDAIEILIAKIKHPKLCRAA